jgi:hypothetical protein
MVRLFALLLLALHANSSVVAATTDAEPPAASRIKAAAADPTGAIFDAAHLLQVEIALDADSWDRLCAEKRTFVSLFRGACFAQPFHNPFTWYRADIKIDGQSPSERRRAQEGFSRLARRRQAGAEDRPGSIPVE